MTFRAFMFIWSAQKQSNLKVQPIFYMSVNFLTWNWDINGQSRAFLMQNSIFPIVWKMWILNITKVCWTNTALILFSVNAALTQQCHINTKHVHLSFHKLSTRRLSFRYNTLSSYYPTTQNCKFGMLLFTKLYQCVQAYRYVDMAIVSQGTISPICHI